jgi:hypothetical protein
MRSWDLVRGARDMSRVVVAVTWLVVAVCEDGEMALRMRCHELGFRTSIVKGLSGGIELKIVIFFCGSA